MSLLHRSFAPSEQTLLRLTPHERNMGVIWKPDPTVPYIIRHVKRIDPKNDLPPDNSIIIRPHVRRASAEETKYHGISAHFWYLTNRDHGFGGRLLEMSDEEILFERLEPDMHIIVRVSQIREDEWEEFRAMRFPSRKNLTRQGLVKLFLDDLD